MKRQIAILVMTILFGWAMQAQAAIYLDEDFEGGTAFTNRANPALTWPVMNRTDPANVSPKGINLRSQSTATAYDWGSDGGTGDQAGDNFQDVVMNHTGTISGLRSFRGANSYALSAGQSIFPTPNSFPWPRDDWYRFWQFAVSVDEATAALAEGTAIGTFEINWSTNGLNSEAEAPEVTVTISLTTNASGEVELVVENDGTVLGTLDGTESSWHVISVISCGNISPAAPYEAGMLWQCWDPFTQTYKGPQPVNPAIPPDQVGTTDDEMLAQYPQTPGGVYVFIDSNVAATFLDPTELGNNWGNPPEGPQRFCAETGWEWNVTNGTVYLDEMYWQGSWNQSATAGGDQEGAARMLAFDAQPEGPLPNAARHWVIF